MRLHPAFVLPVLPSETPTSYLSRVAFQFGRRARQLAVDIGTTFQGVVDGAPAALAVLTDSCGLPRDTFAFTSLVLGESGGFTLAGQEFAKGHLSRSRMFACPQCVTEQGLHGKSHWQVASIRVCLRHDRMLVSLQDRFRQSLAHDFVHLAQEHRDSLATMSVARPPPGSNGLAEYLERRLNGQEESGWLASMPVFAAARSCELVGWAKRSGVHAKWSDASAIERHVAGAVGYSMLSSGPEVFLDFLRELRRDAPPKEFGFRVIYGSMFEFLYNGSEAEPYEPIRSVMRGHLLETAAFGSGETVLGVPVLSRVFHSLRSIGMELAMDQRVVQRRLMTLGVVGEEAATLPGDRVLVDAKQHADTIVKLPEMLERPQAERYLGVKRRPTVALDFSLIAPFCLGPESDDDIFLRSDLDIYLATLTKGAATLVKAPVGCHSVVEAARRAKCSSVDVFRLLREGSLSNVWVDPQRTGVSAIVVSVEEVSRTLGIHGDLMTASDIASALGCGYPIVAALLESGVIQSKVTDPSTSGSTRRIIERRHFSEFNSRYISVGGIAKAAGLLTPTARRLLRKLEVKPDLTITGTQFFERTNIIPVMDRLLA